MARESNAVDFWRGYALAAIFVNHIPGIYYSRFTHTNFSISDSADLFVFLAGWAVRLLAGTGENPQPVAYMVLRVGGRAVTLYAAQVMITVLAIAMLASVAMLRDNALLLEWHNASAVFHDPVPAHIGLALITHQLGYFDILPLYVVLMATIAPVMVVVDRFAPNWLLPLSVVAYLGVLATRFNLPTWPVEGQWFFDPLAWQLVFVLGFVLAKPAGVGAFARRHIAAIRWAALPLVLLSVLVVRFDLWPDPTKMPQPRLFFIANKTFMTPMRLLQFLALVALMSAVFPLIRKAVPKLVDFLCLFGRNSLHVFCVGSLLSLGGQIIRFIYRGNLAIDTIVVVSGIAVMALTAWLPEWRDSIRQQRPRPLPAS